jgi:hypothetical protein
MPKQLMPTAAVAARYRKSQKTIDRWSKIGVIPQPRIINGYKFWAEDELDASDEARERGTPRTSASFADRPKGNTVDTTASADQRKTENAALYPSEKSQEGV